jgi:hypothetical protein
MARMSPAQLSQKRERETRCPALVLIGASRRPQLDHPDQGDNAKKLFGPLLGERKSLPAKLLGFRIDQGVHGLSVPYPPRWQFYPFISFGLQEVSDGNFSRYEAEPGFGGLFYTRDLLRSRLLFGQPQQRRLGRTRRAQPARRVGLRPQDVARFRCGDALEEEDGPKLSPLFRGGYGAGLGGDLFFESLLQRPLGEDA